MSPNAQKFYNLLVAYYIEEPKVLESLRGYSTYKTRTKRKNYNSIIFIETGTPVSQELKDGFDSLTDEEASLILKTFDMKFNPSYQSKEVISLANGVYTTVYPYQKSILGIK